MGVGLSERCSPDRRVDADDAGPEVHEDLGDDADLDLDLDGSGRVLVGAGCERERVLALVDDAAQRVTHIVRGSDLLASTARQIFLQRCLHLPVPHYAHIPVIANSQQLADIPVGGCIKTGVSGYTRIA